jgi:hypothetical protein
MEDTQKYIYVLVKTINDTPPPSGKNDGMSEYVYTDLGELQYCYHNNIWYDGVEWCNYHIDYWYKRIEAPGNKKLEDKLQTIEISRDGSDDRYESAYRDGWYDAIKSYREIVCI